MSKVIVQNLSGDAAGILNFKGLKFNCAQHEDGTTEIEFIDESIGTTCSQEIFDSWKEEYNNRPDESYIYERAIAYPSIGEQLDMIFHAGLGGDEFQAAIQAVKDAYPKPE